MTPTLKRVRPSDTFSITARTHNEFVDAALAHRSRQTDLRRQTGTPDHGEGLVLVRNDSGVNCGRYAVVGLGDPIVLPTLNQASFDSRVALKGVTLTANHLGRFAMLVAPLVAGQMGYAAIGGAHPTKVKIVDGSHGCADIDVADAAQLKSGQFGAATILWAESGIGIKRAVVFLGRLSGFALGKITVAATLASNRWSYTVAEARLNGTGFETISGGATWTGVLNVNEGMNTASGLRGNGVNQSGSAYPAGFSLKPIPVGCYVRVWPVRKSDGSIGFVLEVPNADDGVCS